MSNLFPTCSLFATNSVNLIHWISAVLPVTTILIYLFLGKIIAFTQHLSGSCMLITSTYLSFMMIRLESVYNVSFSWLLFTLVVTFWAAGKIYGTIMALQYLMVFVFLATIGPAGPDTLDLHMSNLKFRRVSHLFEGLTVLGAGIIWVLGALKEVEGARSRSE